MRPTPASKLTHGPEDRFGEPTHPQLVREPEEAHGDHDGQWDGIIWAPSVDPNGTLRVFWFWMRSNMNPGDTGATYSEDVRVAVRSESYTSGARAARQYVMQCPWLGQIEKLMRVEIRDC
jgi:hypothetical protein